MVGISLKITSLFYWLILIGRRLNLFIDDMCNVRPLLQGQIRIARSQSAHNSLIIGLEVCNLKPMVNHGLGIIKVVKFDLGNPLQGQTRTAKI